jgi:hypothetical protein
MFRARIPLVAAVIIAILTAVVASTVQSTAGKATQTTVENRIGNAQKAFPRLDLLRGIELTNETARLAREDEFGDVFAKTGDDQRQAAFVAVQARNARLEQQGRKADLIAVVGANGHVVSRDLNINAMYDDDLKAKYPSVGKALDGVANKDVWSFNGQLYRVGSAPIRSKAGQVVGALVVGFAASAQDASGDRDNLGAEVAYFLDKKVQASSFKKEGGESAEEKALAQALFEGTNLAQPALNGEVTKLFHVTLRGEEFVGAAGPLPGNMTKSASGYVVLSSITAQRTPYESLRWYVLVLGLVALLAAVAAAVMTSMRFLMPLDAVEKGVAEVINGNRDYTFEAGSPDFEGLANGLNVMMARLLGRPDPSDDDVPPESNGNGHGNGGGRWQGELSVEEMTGSQPALDEAKIKLANEAEDAYLRRVFDEYVASRKRTGEGVEGLSLEGFTAKLKQNEASLCKKYNARIVRFQVVVKNGQTTLKPVPIS